jgi:ketosteroid isomerase-like protein
MTAAAQPVRETIGAYGVRYNQKDVAKLVECVTTEGTLIDSDNVATHGREAIGQDFSGAFAQQSTDALEGKVERIRLITPDVAQAEGVSRLVWPKEATTANHFVAVLTRHGDTWKLVEIRDGGPDTSGPMIIARDAQTEQIKSWTFNADGSYMVQGHKDPDAGQFQNVVRLEPKNQLSARSATALSPTAPEPPKLPAQLAQASDSGAAKPTDLAQAGHGITPQAGSVSGLLPSGLADLPGKSALADLGDRATATARASGETGQRVGASACGAFRETAGAVRRERSWLAAIAPLSFLAIPRLVFADLVRGSAAKLINWGENVQVSVPRIQVPLVSEPNVQPMEIPALVTTPLLVETAYVVHLRRSGLRRSEDQSATRDGDGRHATDHIARGLPESDVAHRRIYGSVERPGRGEASVARTGRDAQEPARDRGRSRPPTESRLRAWMVRRPWLTTTRPKVGRRTIASSCGSERLEPKPRASRRARIGWVPFASGRSRVPQQSR